MRLSHVDTMVEFFGKSLLTVFLYVVTARCQIMKDSSSSQPMPCGKAGSGHLKFMWGDALQEAECLGPKGMPYPREAVESIVQQSLNRTLHERRSGRSVEVNGLTWGPTLLSRYLSANGRNKKKDQSIGKGTIPERLRRVLCSPDGDEMGREDRLCQSEYNTTAPLFGVSMTSGETVAIVQKFPDLLQQIVYEKCTSKKCMLVRGTCQQTFVPYLLLTVPLGPVTLTGQDYVLVESGCVCKPNLSHFEQEEENETGNGQPPPI